jgi:selenide,water dikinase
MSEIRLTQFSHGGGCGCKIAPSVLSSILQSSTIAPENKNLLVGNASNDDAAAYDLGNGTAMISTTDFFMPIVDDAFSFGRIASANAISDVYAMGGKPVMAIAILGWPIDKIPAAVAQQVLEGARSICLEAGIPLAGGHSIDSPEPIFGLAVSGLVDIVHLKRNNTAQENDLLFLTKPLGVGIMATAQKREKLSAAHLEQLIKQLGTLNKAGEALGKIAGVHAMTDVTGFGLLGHLTEMAEGSGLSAEITYADLPILEAALEYQKQKIGPGATARNWNSYSAKVSLASGINEEEALQLLPDPQTNGGLLIAVSPEAANEVVAVFEQFGLSAHVKPIGKLKATSEKVIRFV